MKTSGWKTFWQRSSVYAVFKPSNFHLTNFWCNILSLVDLDLLIVWGSNFFGDMGSNPTSEKRMLIYPSIYKYNFRICMFLGQSKVLHFWKNVIVLIFYIFIFIDYYIFLKCKSWFLHFLKKQKNYFDVCIVSV